MDYEVVWDGTARTGRYLLLPDEPTKEAPPMKPARKFPAGCAPKYRVAAVLRALERGPRSTNEVVEITGLSPRQASTVLNYLRSKGRVTITGYDGRARVYGAVGGG